MVTYPRKTILALGVSLGALAAVSPVQAQNAPAAANQTGLEDIIVTAQKREQSLIKVPVSVTALTASTIQANRITSFMDLSAVAPNLTVRASPGGGNVPTMVMRGEFSAPGTPGSEKQVGLYLDGVYIEGGGGSAFNLGNIARIEVLRGPQGTLFGQNATAGAISVFTADPTGKFGGSVDGTIGNYAQKRIRASINTPKFGPFSAYVSYEHFEQNGDVKNLGAGTTWDYSLSDPKLGSHAKSPKYLGSENRETIQAALKFDNGGDVTATYKFLWVKNDSTPEANGFLDLNPDGLCGFAACKPGSLGANIGQLRVNNPAAFKRQVKRPDKINNSFSLPSQFKNEVHILTAQWRATSNLKFKNTFGYLRNTTAATNDLDGLGGLLNSVAALGTVGQPIGIYKNTVSVTNKQWSDELQINFDSKFVTVTAGFLHFDYKGVSGPRDYRPGQLNVKANYTPAQVFDNYVVPGTTAGQLNGVHSKQDALYAQAEIHVTPQLDIIGGLRYTWDNKTSTTDNLAIPAALRNTKYVDSRPSFTVGATYRPQPDVLLFGKYTEGYLAGGAFGGWQWKPETVKSEEVGVKAELFNRKARVALTLFNANYKGVQGIVSGTTIQANLNNQAGCVSTGSNCPGDKFKTLGSTVANSYDTRSRGFEFEANAAPARGLSLGLGVGFSDTKILKTDPLFITNPPFPLRLYFRSKWTANANIGYDTPPLFGDAFLRFRVDANFRSKYILASRAYTAFLAGLYSPAEAIINGRVALTNIELGGAKFEVAGWVRNLTNRRALSYSIVTPYVFSGVYDRARTFGLDARVDF
jgi:iron complex outermembrane receptor protein